MSFPIAWVTLLLRRQFVERRGHIWEINTCQFSPLILIALFFFVRLKSTLGILFYNHQLNLKVKLSWCHWHHLESYVGRRELCFQHLQCVKSSALQNQVALLILFDNQSAKIVKILICVKHLQLGDVIISDRLSPLSRQWQTMRDLPRQSFLHLRHK